MFANTSFTLKHQKDATEKMQVLSCALLGNNTRLMIATPQFAIMYDLGSLSILGKFPLSDRTTTVAAFDLIPDTFYFGITDPSNTQFAIKVLTQSAQVLALNAHSAVITSFECAYFNN